MHLPKFKRPGWTDIRGSFRSRAFHAGGYSLAAAAVVIAIAIAVNLVAGALPAAWTKLDLTDSGLYSLSAQTQQMVSALEDEVTIYWLAQEGYEDSALEQLLERYSSLSGQLKVVHKDPVVYPNFAQQYTSEAISNNSLIVTCGERSRYISYYDIYVTDYSSYYTTGSYSTQFAGESEVTSAINYVTSDELPVVYTLTGHGESALPTDLSAGAEGENLALEELSLLTTEAVPEDADALLIYAPQKDLSDDEKERVLTYLQGGGKLLLVTDYTQEELPNLMEIMAYYGLSSVDGIVLEGDDARYLWGANYYILPDLSSHAITDPILQDGYYVLAPVAQGISVADELREGLTVTALLTTSDAAYSKTAGYDMTTYDREEGDLDGPFTLAAAATETLEEGESGLVWFTTSRMFDTSDRWVAASANLDLFLNALSWLCQQENTLSIRAKNLSTSYLTVPASDASTLSLLLVAVLPLAVLGCGIAVTIRRRRR